MQQGLTNEQLRNKSAAIFARKPSKRVSDKYGFIPTVDMVKAMREAGFVPMQAAGQRSYKGGENNVYGRHMIRFAPAGRTSAIQVGDCIPNVVLYNSHNGRTLYRLIAGLYKLACANGLMVAYRDFGSIEVKHSKNVLQELTEASAKVIEAARDSTRVVGQMRHMHLSDKEQHDYAYKALRLRYSEGAAPIKADQLLTVRRDEDKGDNLWHVFNRVQENIVRGGQEGKATTGRRLTLRPITNIRRDVAINLDLWGMTMRWMEQHGTKPKIVQ